MKLFVYMDYIFVSELYQNIHHASEFVFSGRRACKKCSIILLVLILVYRGLNLTCESETKKSDKYSWLTNIQYIQFVLIVDDISII